MTTQEIKDSLAVSNPELVVCDFLYTHTSTDDLGLPIYKADFITPPTNYKFIRMIEDLKIAVLEDLDYVPAV